MYAVVYVSYISGKLEIGEMRALGAPRKGKELEKASWRSGNWSWVCLKMSEWTFGVEEA